MTALEIERWLKDWIARHGSRLSDEMRLKRLAEDIRDELKGKL